MIARLPPGFNSGKVATGAARLPALVAGYSRGRSRSQWCRLDATAVPVQLEALRGFHFCTRRGLARSQAGSLTTPAATVPLRCLPRRFSSDQPGHSLSSSLVVLDTLDTRRPTHRLRPSLLRSRSLPQLPLLLPRHGVRLQCRCDTHQTVWCLCLYGERAIASVWSCVLTPRAPTGCAGGDADR